MKSSGCEHKMGGSMLTVIDSSFWQFTTDTIQYKQGSDLMIIKGGEHSFFNKEHLYVMLKLSKYGKC